MDALLAAIVALGTVASLAVAVAGACIWVLSNAAKERRDAILRAEVVQRVSELADEPERMMPAVEAVRPLEPRPAHAPDPNAKKKAVANGRERLNMALAHLNPEDPEDVDVYRSMTAMSLDPNDPADVAYYNELGEM